MKKEYIVELREEEADELMDEHWVGELVRCKDCRYCEYPDAEREWCKKGHLHGNANTWFCADGKRR